MSSDMVVGTDAVSKLIQMHARRHGIRFAWIGEANIDIAAFCRDYSNKSLLNQSLWTGVKELAALPEIKDLPEPIQAQIFSIILKAQACFELDMKDRDAKVTQASQATQAPPK